MRHCENSLFVICLNYASIDNWSEKAKRRRTQGTGRMRYMKKVFVRASNGFRESTKTLKMRHPLLILVMVLAEFRLSKQAMKALD